MKKIVTIIATIGIALLLAACGQDDMKPVGKVNINEKNENDFFEAEDENRFGVLNKNRKERKNEESYEATEVVAENVEVAVEETVEEVVEEETKRSYYETYFKPLIDEVMINGFESDVLEMTEEEVVAKYGAPATKTNDNYLIWNFDEKRDDGIVSIKLHLMDAFNSIDAMVEKESPRDPSRDISYYHVLKNVQKFNHTIEYKKIEQWVDENCSGVFNYYNNNSYDWMSNYTTYDELAEYFGDTGFCDLSGSGIRNIRIGWFVPEIGKIFEVWFDRSTGERQFDNFYISNPIAYAPNDNEYFDYSEIILYDVEYLRAWGMEINTESERIFGYKNQSEFFERIEDIP